MIAGVAFSVSVAATDIAPPPPAREEFPAPDKTYVFEVSTPDAWASRKSVGRLFQVAGGTRRLLWSRPLPHEWRPRYVMVGVRGNVLLIDEWANITSRYAVMVVDRENRLVAQHDFDAVTKVLGVPAAQVARMARHGVWIVTPPVWENPGLSVVIEAAGKVMRVNLADGALALAR
jgi:hypothetical protein